MRAGSANRSWVLIVDGPRGRPIGRRAATYLERVTRQPDVSVAEKAFDRVMRGTVVPLYLAGICRS
jgi:hypothetical protein